MLKRAKRLAEAKKASAAQQPPARRPSPADFSLRESALTRVLCFQVGRGQAATAMQSVAHAAVSEAGAANVSKSSSAARVTFSLSTSPMFNVVLTNRYCIRLFCALVPRHRLGIVDGKPWGLDFSHRGHAAQGCFS